MAPLLGFNVLTHRAIDFMRSAAYQASYDKP
jgi:hypothetical protein